MYDDGFAGYTRKTIVIHNNNERGSNMHSEEGRFARPSRLFSPFSWSGLRARMTISYMSVTLGSVLTFMMLAVLVSGVLTSFFSNEIPEAFLTTVRQQAQLYALSAAVQAQGQALDPNSNFIPRHVNTLILPVQEQQENKGFVSYIATTSPNPTSVAFALLIAPDGHLVTSSYPARYPAGTPISTLLSDQRVIIDQALAGQSLTGIERLSSANLAYAAVPVWSKDHRPIGAIFLQVPAPDRGNIWTMIRGLLFVNLVLLVVVTPIGVFFGWITTRGLLHRVQRLVMATTQFSDGDYTQRVASRHRDEIGHLEQQFNTMAGQLVENISRRQQLAERNARLEERSRISRELHDAISQDLFSLRMLADGLQEATRAGSSSTDLRPHITILEQTTSDMTREMRALLLELRPTQLENLGLAGALQKLAHAYSTRLGITVTTDLKPISLDVKAEHALLRIAQEALANAARHSSATLISLCLVLVPQEIELTITDNGQGFASEYCADRHGLGLHLMQERVEELCGIFTIKTAPGQGTCIRVRLPREGVCD